MAEQENVRVVLEFSVNDQNYGPKVDKAKRQFEDFKSSILRGSGELTRALGVGLSVGAVVSFARTVVETASNINDMSQKLGIGVEALQRWKYAAEQSGASIEDIDKAIGFMNKTLSAGGDGTVAILKRAGLEFDAIRAKKPEDAFRAIAEAIRKIPDPMLQAEAATKLFGRNALELLPAIQNGLDDVGSETEIMSEKAVKALDDLGDAYDRMKNRIVVAGADLISGQYFKQMWSDWSTVVQGAIAGVQGKHDEFVESLARQARTTARIAEDEKRLEEAKRRAAAEAAAAALKREESSKKAAEEARKALEAQRRVLEESEAFRRSQDRGEDKRREQEALKAMQDVERQLEDNIRAAARFADAVADFNGELTKSRFNFDLTKLPGFMDAADINAALEKAIPKAPISKRLSEAVKTGLLDAAAGFPDMLASAILHGQNIQEALRATLVKAFSGAGSQFGKGLAADGSKMSGFLGDIFGFAGGLIGDLIGKGISAMIGAFRGKGAKANDLRDAIKEALGGDAAGKGLGKMVEDALKSAGLGSRLADQLFAAWKRFNAASSPEQVKRAGDELERLLEAIRERAQRVQTGIANLLQGVEQFGGRAPRAVRGLVEEMLRLNGLTDEQRRLLGDLVAPAGWEQVEDILESLGSSSERLGENLKKAKQTDFALDLVRKLEFLEDAGADVDGVLFDIRERISDVVNEAIASKTTLPDTLKPFIERALELGLLLGPDGEIRTGIEGIDFAEIKDKPVEDLTKAIMELRDAILGIGKATDQAVDDMNRAFGRARPPRLTDFGSFNRNSDPDLGPSPAAAFTRSAATAFTAAAAITPRINAPQAGEIAAAVGPIVRSGTGVTHLTLEADSRVIGSITLPHQIRILDTDDGLGGPSPRAAFQKAIRLPVGVR